jgi:L-malate glycosyltransferase
VKIVISSHPTQGGSGIVASELATELVQRGHEVHLAAYTKPYRLLEGSGVIYHKVTVPDYPLFRTPPEDLSLANKLANITREYNIDIIHAHYAIPHAVTALLARQIVQPHKVKIVTTLHGTDITFVGSQPEFFDLIQHAMKESDALTSVSSWLQQQTMKRFSLPVKPEIITNFINTRRFTPVGRRPYPEAGEPFRLIHASNLRPVKRIADIIRVFELVQKQIPAHLTILGEGPQKGLAAEMSAELGLCSKICFTSTAKNVPQALANTHLKLLLSDYESFGLAALEAMACGTPVAASNRGGLPEVIRDNVTGLLCELSDINLCADRIVALLKDRARWEAMSNAAVEVANEEFSVSKIVPQYEALYERILEDKTESTPLPELS